MSAKKKKKKAHAHAHHHEHEHEHEHDHDHDHDHPHDHDHGHGHGHEHELIDRPDLPRGAGKGKILFFDAPSGLAGDMIIAALCDLGVPYDVIGDAVAALDLDDFHLHFDALERSGIIATKFDVHVEGKQPERTYGTIKKILKKAKLTDGVRALALATFQRLAESEARVHRMPVDDVHFHEVGAIDAIVDVVGSAAALDYLGADVIVSPLPMGHGRIKARHGILPLPAPATVECLKGLETYDGGLAFELVTPTGAAIMGAHAKRSAQWPSMKPEVTGWGAGTKDLADRPNLLRVVLGTEVTTRRGRGHDEGTHIVLEANLDDATGELLAHTIASLLEAGALDAWTVPITMKKGRPANILCALASEERAEHVATAMLRESTSLGVRRYAVDRIERPRKISTVMTPFGEIPVKVAGGPFGPPQRKPEVDACIAAAKAHGVPLRQVLDAAMTASAGLK
jgi:uncharacterized protein (TIGR00299 family) protein